MTNKIENRKKRKIKKNEIGNEIESNVNLYLDDDTDFKKYIKISYSPEKKRKNQDEEDFYYEDEFS